MVRVGESYPSPRSSKVSVLSTWTKPILGLCKHNKRSCSYILKFTVWFADEHLVKNSFKASDRGMENKKWKHEGLPAKC